MISRFLCRTMQSLLLASLLPLASLASQTARNLTDRKGDLILYRAGEESLAISSNKEGRTLISRYEDAAVRRIYDGTGRIARRETWSVLNKAKVKEEKYSYRKDGTSFCAITEMAKDGKRITEQYYNAECKITEVRQWIISAVENEDGSMGKEEKHLLKVIKTNYAKDGNVSDVITISRGDDGGKKMVQVVYDGDDTYRYENGVLRESTVHTSEGDYIQTVVFGDGENKVMAVTEYKNSRKVSSKVIKK